MPQLSILNFQKYGLGIETRISFECGVLESHHSATDTASISIRNLQVVIWYARFISVITLPHMLGYWLLNTWAQTHQHTPSDLCLRMYYMLNSELCHPITQRFAFPFKTWSPVGICSHYSPCVSILLLLTYRIYCSKPSNCSLSLCDTMLEGPACSICNPLKIKCAHMFHSLTGFYS